MGHRHLVWDWNGTLLDDLEIVISAVNASLAAFDAGPIDADEYRDHYTRPVRVFYDNLLGRAISDEEWLRLNTTFHDEYFRLATDVDLAPGAREAIARLDAAGWSQSLLSMSPQGWLDQIVARLALTDDFELVDGIVEATGGLKAPELSKHLKTLDRAASEVVMIGDTPDDVAAANHVGASPILFDGGSHHRLVLEAEGAPIASSLLEAVELALGSAG